MDTNTVVEGEEEEPGDENVTEMDTQVLDKDEENDAENVLNETEVQQSPEAEEDGLDRSRTASNISRRSSRSPGPSRRSSRSRGPSGGSAGGRRSRSANGGRRSTVDLTEACTETIAEKVARTLLRLQEKKKARDEAKSKKDTYDG